MPISALQIVAVGNIAATLLKGLDEPLHIHLGLSINHAKDSLPAPAYAFNKDRQQYHANALLRRIAALSKGPSEGVLAVCDVDLFVPDSPFVFGEADRQSRAAVISTYRLSPNVPPEQVRRRAQAEAVHQAGHLLGLSPCDDVKCAMFAATTVAENDRRGLGLCNACRQDLGRLT